MTNTFLAFTIKKPSFNHYCHILTSNNLNSSML